MAYTDDCGFYAAVSEDYSGRAVCHPAAACPSPSPNMTNRRDCSPQIVGVEVLLYYPARGVTRSLRSMAAGVSTGPPNRRCRGHGSLLSQSISALKPHMRETSVPWSSRGHTPRGISPPHALVATHGVGTLPPAHAVSGGSGYTGRWSCWAVTGPCRRVAGRGSCGLIQFRHEIHVSAGQRHAPN